MSTIGKLALSILLIVAIVGAALWILGGKQTEYLAELSIDAPPESIFPYLTQPEQLKSWQTGLTEISELLPAPKVDGVVSGKVQKTARIVSMPDGSQVRFADRVIRYQENLSISVQSSNAQKILLHIYQLEPRDGQTFLSYRLKASSCGTGRFMAPLFKINFQDRMDSDIRKLKDLVESSPRVPTETNGVPSELNHFVPEPETQSDSAPDVSDLTPDVSDSRDAETPVTGQPFSF